MSAPNTNTEKQTRRHRPSLVGIAVAVGFAAIALIVFLSFISDPDDTLVEDDAIVTGEEAVETVGDDPVATMEDANDAASTEDSGTESDSAPIEE